MTNSESTNAAPPADKHQGTLLAEAVDKEASDTDHIYLDLDVILDTRLGTLARMGNEHAVRALSSGLYHKRALDEFEGISVHEFREAYAKRDIETLKLSVLSNTVFFLRRLIKDSLLSAAIHQKVERLCFTVNVWPYDFSDPGLVEMLIGCIRFHTYSTASVRIVSISDEALVPRYCLENYQIMIRYEYLKWVELHKEYFEQRGIPSVTLVVPELFYETVPTQDDIDQLDMKKVNPFKLMETHCAALFRLKYMPVSMFSIHENITAQNAATVATRAQVTQEDIEAYLGKHYPKATLVQEDPLPKVDLDDAFQLL